MKTYRLRGSLNNIDVLSLKNDNKLYLLNNDTYNKRVKIIDTTYDKVKRTKEYIIKPKELIATGFSAFTFIIDVDEHTKECDGRLKRAFSSDVVIEIIGELIEIILDAL